MWAGSRWRCRCPARWAAAGTAAPRRPGMSGPSATWCANPPTFRAALSTRPSLPSPLFQAVAAELQWRYQHPRRRRRCLRMRRTKPSRVGPQAAGQMTGTTLRQRTCGRSGLCCTWCDLRPTGSTQRGQPPQSVAPSSRGPDKPYMRGCCVAAGGRADADGAVPVPGLSRCSDSRRRRRGRGRPGRAAAQAGRL